MVDYISDRSMVMYLGRIVESAATRKLFSRLRHPYTETLLNAIPKRSGRGHRRRSVLAGDIPSPVNPPSGCAFHTRCKYAQDLCKIEMPVLQPVDGDPDIQVACHFGEELDLQPFA